MKKHENLEKLDVSEALKRRFKNEVIKISFMGILAVAVVVAFIIVSTSIFFGGRAPKVLAEDLMHGIKPQKVETVELKDEFTNGAANFSVDLFKQAYKKGENSLVSPTSVYLALGITANGSDGNTLKEFENLLGKNNLNIQKLNTYYNSLSKKLTKVNSGKLSIANSIWFRQNLDVKKDFLQINANYFNASVYEADFNNANTVKDINNWVKLNTSNTIDKIITEIDKNTIMYLINAVAFEDKWEKNYNKSDVLKDYFQLEDGTKQTVNFMHSEENWYVKADKVTGFIKPYKNGKYSFLALLPNNNISIDNYIASLSGEDITWLLKNKTKDTVKVALPEFKVEDQINLKPALEKMGLKDCFIEGKANFANMANNSEGIYLRDILHKTYVSVDHEGTKAGASTKVEMAQKSISTAHSIILNRPFIYAIIDNETNLPLFIGTMMKPAIEK